MTCVPAILLNDAQLCMNYRYATTVNVASVLHFFADMINYRCYNFVSKHDSKLWNSVSWFLSLFFLKFILEGTVCVHAVGLESCNWYSNWLQAGQPRGLSLSPSRGKNFLFSTSSQIGSGVNLASCAVGTRGFLPGGKATWAWSWPLTSN
jgi:hypothetical protein